MGDISTWSAIDESNTMAPPDGWPEAQATNTVNNCARAMMGATRRWYDTVTAQLIGMMPRAGGAFTGPVEVPSLTSAGNIIAGGQVQGALLYSTANIHADTNIVANGQVQGALLYSTANIHADTSIVANGNITAGGQVQAGYLYSTANIQAATNITATGNITAGNTVTGNTVAAAGTVSGDLVAGNSLSSNTTVTAIQYNLRGNAFAEMDAGGARTSIYGPGFQSISMYASGTNYYDNASHIMRSGGGGTTYFVANAGGTFNQNGSWGVISDDSLKQNVAPYTAGLAQLRQLNPVSFEYTSGAALRGAEGTVNYGLMASEVQPVIPEMVSEATLDVDGVPTPTQTLLPTHLVYILINTCKELAARLEDLEVRVNPSEEGKIR